jgi:hypothetical protein
VIHDDRGVLVPALVGELVDTDEGERFESLGISFSRTTRPAMRPTVTQEIPKSRLTVVLSVARVSPAT